MSNLLDTAGNEVMRKEILELCEQAAPYGAGLPVLKAALRKCGYELDEKELLKQVDYLAGKGLVKKEMIENQRLNISRCIVFLTPEGTDYLEGNGTDVTGVW